MSQVKGLLKSTSIYVILGFLPMGINFLLLPILSTELSESEYGLLALAGLFVGVITIFIGLGLEGAFSRYYFQYYKKPNLVSTLLSTLIITVLISASIFGVILHFFGDVLFKMFLSNDIFTYSDYGVFIFLTTVNTILNGLFLIYFRNEEKPLGFALTSVSFFLLSLTGILIGVLYFKQGALGSIIGRFFGSIPVTLILLFYFYSKIKTIKFEFRFLKILFHYTTPLIPYLLILYLYNNIDKIMVEKSFGENSLDYLGKYNLAFQIGTAIQVLLYSMFNSISPQVYKALVSKNADSLVYSIKLLKTFHLVIIGVIVCFIASSELLFTVFIDEKFHDGIQYLGILSLIYVPQLYYVMYTIPLFYNKLTKTLPYISFVALIAGVISNLILIPIYGIIGVCIATLCTKLAQFIATYFYLKKYDQLDLGFTQMRKNHILAVTIVSVYLLLYWLFFEFSFIDNLSINYLNIIPLFVFAGLLPVLFKKEISSLPLLFKNLKN